MKRKITDSRKEPRRPVSMRATVSVDGQVVSARTRDISRSGICLVSDTPIPRDTELTISLVLALSTGTVSEPLRLLGRSAWCTAMFGKFQIGAKFVGIDAERRRFLDLFIRFIDGEVNPAGAATEVEHEDSGPRRKAAEDPDDPFRP
jgi:hypothetical protein